MIEVKVEQINVSDDEYELVQIYAEENQKVETGDLIISYESSKASFDVEAEISGYVKYPPNLQLGSRVKVGEVIAFICDDPDAEFATVDNTNFIADTDISRFSRKAAELIQKNQLSYETFMHLEFVSLADVKNYIDTKADNEEISNIKNFQSYQSNILNFSANFERIALIGAGKTALQILDSLNPSLQQITHIYDTNIIQEIQTIMDIPVTSGATIKTIEEDFKSGRFDKIVIAFSGDIQSRGQLFNALREQKIPIANIVSKDARISKYSELGVGNVILGSASIGPFTKICDNNFISSGVSIEHNCLVGSGNTFGPGVMTSGSCKIGNQNKFGMQIGLEPKVSIGDRCIIASGVILTRHIDNDKLVRNLAQTEIINLK